MLISYDIDGKSASKGWSRPQLVLAFLNGAVAAVMLSAWTFLSMFLTEPIEWATWMRVRRGNGLMDAFDYPFVLLWALPAAGVIIAWLGVQNRKSAMTYWGLTMPLLILGFMIGWFYLTPPEWH